MCSAKIAHQAKGFSGKVVIFPKNFHYFATSSSSRLLLVSPGMVANGNSDEWTKSSVEFTSLLKMVLQGVVCDV